MERILILLFRKLHLNGSRDVDLVHMIEPRVIGQSFANAQMPGAGKTVSILGVPLAFGQSMGGVELGPSAIRVAGLTRQIATLGYDVNDRGDLHVDRPRAYPHENERLKYLTEVHATCSQLAALTEKIVDAGELPITIGGDHSIAI